MSRTIDDQTIELLLSDLNEQQRHAACAGDGPLLIVAGAGTGKTTTLAHRVAWQILTGAAPERILLLTFTRRSAAEMLRRVEALLRRFEEAGTGRGRVRLNSRRVWGGTFHAIATRLLRKFGRLIGLEPDFTIFDRSDAEDLINVLRGDLKLTEADKRFPLKGTCLDIYSRCMNTQVRLEPVLRGDFPWVIEHADDLKRLFEAYVDRKEQQGILDYDDLLVFWKELAAHEEAGAAVREMFDSVLVDEYQDTNLLQAEILRHLSPHGRGLTVVGDDAQSIYSFRAATVRNILDFPDQYPGTTIVPLEQNYRSTQPILDATNAVIAQAAERHRKELWSTRQEGAAPQLVNCQDEDEQTDFVIDQILEHREKGVPLREQAVLFRASHHSLQLEVELSRRNIPYHKYGGLKFIETAHVKDLLAFLRLAENPRDFVSALRVLMLIPGIGRKKAAHLFEKLSEAKHDFAAWREYAPPVAAQTHWPLFVALMRRLRGPADSSRTIATEVGEVRRFYAPLLEVKHDHAKMRLRDLEQLEQVAARFPDRGAFLSEITLDPPSSTQDLPADPLLDEDYLILSTIHSAKGLEWDAVYVVHAADGNIPSDMATKSPEEIEEERRLFYVALTRARNWLYVCHPHRYYFHNRARSDAHSYSQLTRFLTADVLQKFQTRSAVTSDEEQPGDVATPHMRTEDVRARMKTMWDG